jgi:hypothetical protein
MLGAMQLQYKCISMVFAFARGMDLQKAAWKMIACLAKFV